LEALPTVATDKVGVYFKLKRSAVWKGLATVKGFWSAGTAKLAPASMIVGSGILESMKCHP